ncbi:MAG TPA: hypothetical protein VGS22_29500 [Thermoanaerobaculia bacterium]|jgi:V8-like Glu-specific endopeptidase|nr:hypothetical protein [Thermoanaerobaculia bacterium]
MFTRIPGKFGRITFVALTVFLPFASSLQAESLTLSKTISKAEQAAAQAYWTRERIAAAPALQMVDKGLGVLAPAAAEIEEDFGPAGSTPAGMADPGAIQLARKAYPKDWAALEEDGVALDYDLAPDLNGNDTLTGTAGIYTSYDVNTNTALWQIYPHRWIGRLTFTTPSGNASCSATSISGNNFVTAAHCIYDSTNNLFYSNWVFSPAYRNGSTPNGKFAATTCTILTAWANLTGSYSISGWTRYDVAVCTVGTNSSGQTLNTAVGFAGRIWGAGNNQLSFIAGYPQQTYTGAIISNGPTQYLRSCTAESFSFTTDTLGAGCSWGPGISGGPWLLGYKPFVVSGQVNSVCSGLFIGQQNMYGIKFTSNNIVPVCTARGC